MDPCMGRPEEGEWGIPPLLMRFPGSALWRGRVVPHPLPIWDLFLGFLFSPGHIVHLPVELSHRHRLRIHCVIRRRLVIRVAGPRILGMVVEP